MLPLNFDMNLLVVLGVLMEERSVTRTGVRLGRTQSAISNSLKKLRDALDDPLLVKGPNGMVLTPKAVELQDQVQTILNMTQDCLLPQRPFEPSTASGRFRISAPDRLSLPVMLPFLKFLRRAARQVAISVSNFSTVASLLRDSDMIGIYAQRVADVLAEDTGLISLRLPSDIEKFDHYLVWHNRYDADPRHQWLRDQIMAAEGPPA